MSKDTQRLRIALQKSGRLHEDSLAILRLCGIKLTPDSRQLLCRSEEMPLDLLFIRDDDIPGFVAEGICDLGIVGENIYWEEHCAWEHDRERGDHISDSGPFRARVSRKLGFSRCRLSLAGPAEFARRYQEQGPKALQGCTIASSYPASLEHFLKENNVQAEIIKMKGSVELAPKLGIADLICDLISTGSTLVANNLVECHSFLKSEAVLLEHGGNEESRTDWSPQRLACFQQLQTRLDGVLRARNSKYVMMNAPKDKVLEISRLLPGADSPTVIPLGDPEQVAIHVVSGEPVVWETMEALKAAGAHSILIQSIEKVLL
ncbi:ATP phosphoribosyltransferase [Candidatus Haliotispira prima]|uniref:ATP phosphoribosyltransferase n=1 Tax=Candidatus Haliotispira prima TaxID=3034016 RepID=A0ABY8MG00_9SPIO|nr:ATP phosphoribosyltransferase [Candidatus Haliotispira prima]